MSTLTATTPATARHQRRERSVAVAATGVTALAVWAVVVPLLGISLRVSTSPGSSSEQNVGAASVLAASLLVSLLGWGLLVVLERHTARATTVWTFAAVTVLLVSLVGPLASATSTSAATSLIILHVSVAAVLVSLLRRTAVNR